MFERFKTKAESKAADLTTLGLRDAPRAEASSPAIASPAAASPATDSPAAGQGPDSGLGSASGPERGLAGSASGGEAPVGTGGCPSLVLSLQAASAHHMAVQQIYDQLANGGQRPELVFYLVYPQQGHLVSVTTTDGTKTILLLFRSSPAAKAYAAIRAPGASVAASRLEGLAREGEQWQTAGCNFYALDPCARCQGMSIAMISRLQSETEFLHSWNLEAANRRSFGQMFLRNFQAQMAKNAKGNCGLLQGFRDHIDPCNPYLHLTIAGTAGMNRDQAVVSESARQLAEFGPAFAGKIPAPGPNAAEFWGSPDGVKKWTDLISEGLIGLLAGYGVIQVPGKASEGAKESTEGKIRQA